MGRIKEHKLIKKGGLILALLVCCFCILTCINGFSPIPGGWRSIYYLLSSPKDLYNPVVQDPFKFNEVGYKKTYEIKPKYLGIHVVGILNKGKGIPKDKKFRGKIRISFFNKERFIEKIDVDDLRFSYIDTENYPNLKIMGLHEFNLPYKKKYLKDLRVQVEVIEPYVDFVNFEDSSYLFISYSPRP